MPANTGAPRPLPSMRALSWAARTATPAHADRFTLIVAVGRSAASGPFCDAFTLPGLTPYAPGGLGHDGRAAGWAFLLRSIMQESGGARRAPAAMRSAYDRATARALLLGVEPAILGA